MSVDRGFTWMEDETIALINIFSKSDIQSDLTGSKRNISVYERISSELSVLNFSRSASQCRQKIKRLRKEYHSVKSCYQNNSIPKKTMKHFELLENIFSTPSLLFNSCPDLSEPTSDQDEEINLSSAYIGYDLESETSDNCIQMRSILPEPICSLLSENDENSSILFDIKTNSPPLDSNENQDTLLENDSYDLTCGQNTQEESLWVPNVVLVENDLESENSRNYTKTSEIVNEVDLFNKPSCSTQFSIISDLDEPPKKKRKTSFHVLLKRTLNKVTDNFLSHLEKSETRFLETITHIEQERLKREENMQKMWLEFEERRRKESREHELRLLSLLSQIAGKGPRNGNHLPML